ncbi:uncharacterized protein SPSK_05913 [Sporothrix schenckii 1099-18]|uniref:Uncharacterized protein n=1 Tax=Sporothrix schenckii 1099-18 TaxID=1397361 RepID=A0A0F2ML83_SPOSC|nr:uncharacterized protein SPSK_05913 [Sporothrix schenckii 1099-18]KJR89590.1 hypothetical protein SPSK_05913 [Sporothrix schenckii 1099-18]
MAVTPGQYKHSNTNGWVFQPDGHGGGAFTLSLGIENMGYTIPLHPDQVAIVNQAAGHDDVVPPDGSSLPQNTAVDTSVTSASNNNISNTSSMPINTNAPDATTGTTSYTIPNTAWSSSPTSTSTMTNSANPTTTSWSTTTTSSSAVDPQVQPKWTDPAKSIDMKTNAYAGAFGPDSSFEDAAYPERRQKQSNLQDGAWNAAMKTGERSDSAMWIDEAKSTPAPTALAAPASFAFPTPTQMIMSTANMGGAPIAAPVAAPMTVPTMQAFFDQFPIVQPMNDLSPTTSSSTGVTDITDASSNQMHMSPRTSSGGLVEAPVAVTTTNSGTLNFTPSDIAMYGSLMGHSDLQAYLPPATAETAALGAVSSNTPFVSAQDSSVLQAAQWNIPFTVAPATNVFAPATTQPTMDPTMNMPMDMAFASTAANPTPAVVGAGHVGNVGSAPVPQIEPNSHGNYIPFVQHPNMLQAPAQWAPASFESSSVNFPWLPVADITTVPFPPPPLPFDPVGPLQPQVPVTPQAPQVPVTPQAPQAPQALQVHKNKPKPTPKSKSQQPRRVSIVLEDPKPSTSTSESSVEQAKRPQSRRVSQSSGTVHPVSGISRRKSIPPPPLFNAVPAPQKTAVPSTGIKFLPPVSVHVQTPTTSSPHKHTRVVEIEGDESSPLKRTKQQPSFTAQASPQQTQTQHENQERKKETEICYDMDANGQYDARIPRFPTGPGQVPPTLGRPCVIPTPIGEVLVPCFNVYAAEVIANSDAATGSEFVLKMSQGLTEYSRRNKQPLSVESEMARIAKAQKRGEAIAKARAKAEARGKAQVPQVNESVATQAADVQPSMSQAHAPSPFERATISQSLRGQPNRPMSTAELNVGQNGILPMFIVGPQAVHAAPGPPNRPAPTTANIAGSVDVGTSAAQSFSRPVSRVPLPATAMTVRPQLPISRKPHTRASTRLSTLHCTGRGANASTGA